MKIRVLLIEDEESWVSIIQGYIAQAEDITLVRAVKDETEMVDVLHQQAVDVVLLDLCLGTGMEGIELAGEINRVSGAKIIVLTSVREMPKELLYKGIAGYLYKNQMDVLCSTIRDVAAGEYPYERMFQEHRKYLVREKVEVLSERERSILRPWMQGKTMIQISVAQGVSENTVKHQVGNIYKKLGITQRSKRREQLRAWFKDVIEYL